MLKNVVHKLMHTDCLKDASSYARKIAKICASDHSGFTLIELILVTVIIAILAGMVTLSFQGRTTEAKRNAALGDIKSYESAIELFALENNDRYPTTLSELVSGGKQYVRELSNDPWGNPYIYTKPGSRHKDSYDLMSGGPDGVVGGGDDVAPWLTDPKE